MPSSIIKRVKLNFSFQSRTKTYGAPCPKHCSSHSPAEPKGWASTPAPINTFHRALMSLCQQFLYHLWSKQREKTEESIPPLGCFLCAKHLWQPECWSGFPISLHSVLGQPCWARQSLGFQGLMPCQGSKAVHENATSWELIRQSWACSSSRL